MTEEKIEMDRAERKRMVELSKLARQTAGWQCRNNKATKRKKIQA